LIALRFSGEAASISAAGARFFWRVFPQAATFISGDQKDFPKKLNQGGN
jgi:hypothetical protein